MNKLRYLAVALLLALVVTPFAGIVQNTVVRMTDGATMSRPAL